MPKHNLLDSAKEFIQLSVDYFCIANQKGYFVDLSPNWEKLLGYSLEELTTQPITNFVHPDDVPKTLTELQKLLERKTEFFVNRYLRKDGHIVYLSWRAAQHDSHDVNYAIATDVTELYSNQKLLEITQQTAKIGGWKVDIEKQTCHWSDQVYDIHEVEKGTLIKVEDGINFYTPEHRPIISKYVEEAILNNKHWDVELQIITAKGNTKWVRAIGYPVLVNEQPVRLEGVFQDIHTRKTKELEVFRNNALLKATFDSFPSSLIFVNTNREIQDVSRYFEYDFGYKLEEVKGKTTQFIYKNPEDFEKKSAKKFSLDSDIDLTPYEMEYVRKDGTTFWGQTIGSVIKGENNEPIGFIGAIRDLTVEYEQRKNLERERARLIQASKMSTLGEMAGGIAHEINNPLAIIQGYSHKLEALATKSSSVPSTEALDLGQSLLKAVDRMAKIISGLRIFARDGTRKRNQIFTAQKLIDETLSFCERRFNNHDVSLSIQGDTEAKIFGQEIQLSQVLLNLLNNAFDAVKTNEESGRRIEVNVSSDEGYTVFNINDWGPGVTEEESQRILEPFFTTKEIGEGTGLGLSISKGIVEDHNGTLSITSLKEPTTFNIRLPNSSS